MSRFGPTFRPTTTVPTAFDAFNEVFDRGVETNERRRLRERQKQEDARAEETRSLADAFNRARAEQAGIRTGTAPESPSPEPRRRIVPGIGSPDGSPAAQQLQGVERSGRPGLQAGDQTGEPEVVVPAGAFTPGVGFAPRNLTTVDTEDERFVQLTKGFFLDRQATPEARQTRQTAARQTEERRRMERVLGALQQGGRDPALQAEALDLGVPSSQVFQDDEAPDEPVIKVGGREFPDTMDGVNAALAWQRSLGGAQRQPESAGDSDRIPGETSRRALTTAAVRAVAQIRQEVAALYPEDIEFRFPGGEAEFRRDTDRRIQEQLQLFGFNSVDELQSELRRLRRVSDPEPGDPEPQGVGSTFVSPEVDDLITRSIRSSERGARDRDSGFGNAESITEVQIDKVLEANPDLSDAEIARLLRGGRGR